jgi:WD40-like Beta Propeller Repeat
MTAVSPTRRGPAGLAGLAGVLAVIGVAVVALLLGSGSVHAVAPARSPLPGAPQGVPQADGAIVYGRYLPHSGSDGFVRGLSIAEAAGGAPRKLTAGVVCCASAGAHTVLFTQRTPRGTRDDLVSVRPGGVAIHPVALPGMTLGPGVVSADGSRIAAWARSLADRGRGAVELRWGGRWTRLGGLTHQVLRPLAFSPDGGRLLVFRSRSSAGFGAVGVIRIGDGRYQRETPRGMTSWCCYFGSPASWSPSGRIAFAAFKHAPKGDASSDGVSAVFVTEHSAEGVRRVTDWGSGTTSARWSPDSRLLAYDMANQPGGPHDLFVIDPDGGSPLLVATPNDAGACCADWSPNGKALVYEAGRSDGHMDLWTANVDGTGTFRLTTDHARDLAYAVMPPP